MLTTQVPKALTDPLPLPVYADGDALNPWPARLPTTSLEEQAKRLTDSSLMIASGSWNG